MRMLPGRLNARSSSSPGRPKTDAGATASADDVEVDVGIGSPLQPLMSRPPDSNPANGTDIAIQPNRLFRSMWTPPFLTSPDVLVVRAAARGKRGLRVELMSRSFDGRS